MKQVNVLTEARLCLSKAEIEQGLPTTRVEETTYSIVGTQEQHLCPHCGQPVMLLMDWGTYKVLCPNCAAINKATLYRNRGGDIYTESLDELTERCIEYFKEGGDYECAFEIL